VSASICSEQGLVFGSPRGTDSLVKWHLYSILLEPVSTRKVLISNCTQSSD
jgi:hypothetical protein